MRLFPRPAGLPTMGQEIVDFLRSWLAAPSGRR